MYVLHFRYQAKELDYKYECTQRQEDSKDPIGNGFSIHNSGPNCP